MYDNVIEYLSVELDDAITQAQEFPNSEITLFLHEPILVSLATRILEGMAGEGDKEAARIKVELGVVH